MNNILMQLINQFMPFAQEHIGFNEPPKLFLKQDKENASNPLGKTAFYDPTEKSVTLYVTGRHPKDILRSLGHELVHHKQNCDGKFENVGDMGEGYAQKNPHLRQMEFEANSVGSMCLRDFEDGLREQKTIYYEHLQKGEKTMSTKDWKNKELTTLLSEAWGFKFNTLQEFDEFNGTGEIQEVSDQEGKTDAEEETRGTATDTWEKDDLEESAELTETGAKDTGASKGDKGKDKEDPKDRDYSGHGMRKGDESDTHPGEKDDTTKKGDELKHGGKGRGEKKGDKAYINEDSGWDEKEHDEHNAWNDEDHIEAIEKHLSALKHDRDYEEDHESLEEGEDADLEELAQARAGGDRRKPHKRTPVPEDDEEKDELREAIKALLGKYIKG